MAKKRSWTTPQLILLVRGGGGGDAENVLNGFKNASTYSGPTAAIQCTIGHGAICNAITPS